jgi:hypothetical protein
MSLLQLLSSTHTHSHTTRGAHLAPTGEPIRWHSGLSSGWHRSTIQKPGKSAAAPAGLRLWAKQQTTHSQGGIYEATTGVKGGNVFECMGFSLTVHDISFHIL